VQVAMFGDLYRGNNVWRLITWIQCMDTHREGTMLGFIAGTMFGESRRVCNFRRPI